MMPQYIEQFRVVPSIFKVPAPTIHLGGAAVPRGNCTQQVIRASHRRRCSDAVRTKEMHDGDAYHIFMVLSAAKLGSVALGSYNAELSA